LYWPHKYSGSEKVYDATISDLEEAAQILVVPNDLDYFNILLTNSCKNCKVTQTTVGYDNKIESLEVENEVHRKIRKEI
jgi:RIO-like serine/threonine protein kinase